MWLGWWRSGRLPVVKTLPACEPVWLRPGPCRQSGEAALVVLTVPGPAHSGQGVQFPPYLGRRGSCWSGVRKRGAAIRTSPPSESPYLQPSPRLACGPRASPEFPHAHLMLKGLPAQDRLASKAPGGTPCLGPASFCPVSSRGSPRSCEPAALGPMSSVNSPMWHKMERRWAVSPWHLTNPIRGQGTEQTHCAQRRGWQCWAVQGLV